MSRKRLADRDQYNPTFDIQSSYDLVAVTRIIPDTHRSYVVGNSILCNSQVVFVSALMTGESLDVFVPKIPIPPIHINKQRAAISI